MVQQIERRPLKKQYHKFPKQRGTWKVLQLCMGEGEHDRNFFIRLFSVIDRKFRYLKLREIEGNEEMHV